MEENKIKTKFRIEQEAKETAIYNEYNALMSQRDAKATLVRKYLCEKYGFGASTTIWFIYKRVEKRLKKEGKL
ncbi:MAG: hypothetical protein FWF53_05680 [Candidatus Azobacteroides sp.]|nr:hypothetical protein [Candidatus Azobacteroides sp.]